MKWFVKSVCKNWSLLFLSRQIFKQFPSFLNLVCAINVLSPISLEMWRNNLVEVFQIKHGLHCYSKFKGALWKCLCEKKQTNPVAVWVVSVTLIVPEGHQIQQHGLFKTFRAMSGRICIIFILPV